MNIRVLNITLFYIFIISNGLFCQYYNRNWVIGYGSNEELPNKYGKMILDFDTSPVFIHYSPKGKQFELGFSTSCISNRKGNFLFYSDNKYLIDCNHEILCNGDSINPGQIRDIYINSGYPTSTASFFLPNPADPNKYYFIHRSMDLTPKNKSYKPTYSDKFYYTTIEINKSYPKGIVTKKNQLLLNGDFVQSHLAACKHGNGRDWWIVLEESGTNKHFIFLLDPSGIRLHHEQIIGFTKSWRDFNGDCLFTNDGNKYIKSTIDDQIQIFDFDRCNGIFSNPVQIIIPSTQSESSLMICASPNSKYLYASISKYIFQYSLSVNNITSSIDTVAIWDGFLYSNKFSTAFYQMGIAGNGKIYITCKSGGPYIHVINKPNLKGKECKLVQRGIKLPANYAFGIPSMPNYNLGPIDGSSCDYLGINNILVAYWQYEKDSNDFKKIEFTDLSSKETKEWNWDFGDGSTSSIQYPSHNYLYSGNYKVCLTIKNNNGYNTYCRFLNIGTFDSLNYKINLDIEVYPNPFPDYININLADYNYLNSICAEFYNQLGEKIISYKLNQRTNYIKTDQLSSGVYFLKIVSSDRTVQSFKIFKY